MKISCTSTNCNNNLHCFQLTKKQARVGPSGRCRDCDAQLVDWVRVHRRDAEDFEYTLEALRFELIRHHFWHIPLSDYAVNYARRKGRAELYNAVQRQIGQAVGRADHPAQGRQTPRETSPKATAVHYAQHATASCCRKCVEEWHAIPRDRDLKPEEIRYLTDLAMKYIMSRIPDLADGPMRIPKRPPRSSNITQMQSASPLRHAS